MYTSKLDNNIFIVLLPIFCFYKVINYIFIDILNRKRALKKLTIFQAS